jgi:RNA polymerase sigma factor (sigma-70 family)
MQALDDMQLLQQYASGRSEEAFSALVSRHINLVFSAALRSVNNPALAEEITQAVFVMLARKAQGLRHGTVLSGWLYQTARLTAANFLRTETRRQQREHQAYIQSTMNEPEPEAWTRVGPLLEEAMAQLNEKDRDAIVLRFFEGKALKEVGNALGATEDAAKMRVSRALDKLRDFFHRRGITLSAGALSAAIAENSIQAAPMGLATSVASAAAGIVQGPALTASTLTLVRGTIHMMTSTKIGVAIGACAAATIIGLQWQQVSSEKQLVKQLQDQVSEQAQSNRAQLAELQQLRERMASDAKSMDAMSRDAAKSRANASAAREAKLTAEASKKAAASASNGNPLAAMFKDPDLMKAMRDQQASMLKMQYAPLVKQLNLSPEQTDKFYQILVDQASKGLEALQSGKFSPDDMKSNTQSTQADLQALLGDAGMTQYKDFTDSVGDQTMLSLYKNNFADNPLSDTQQQQLLQAMKTARQNATASGTADPSQSGDMAAMMGQAMQKQDEINQSVLQQAAAFLSPDQLQTLATSQSNMLGMQKVGMSMAQKMFSNAPAGP